MAQTGASTIQKQDLDGALAEARQTLEMTRAEADKTSAELATQAERRQFKQRMPASPRRMRSSKRLYPWLRSIVPWDR